MEGFRKVHTLSYMVFSQITDLRIVVYCPVLFRIYCEYKKIPLARLHQVFQINGNPHIFSVVFCQKIAAILNQAGHIQTPYFIGQPPDMGIVLLDSHTKGMVL